jgi:hypothetical protein
LADFDCSADKFSLFFTCLLYFSEQFYKMKSGGGSRRIRQLMAIPGRLASLRSSDAMHGADAMDDDRYSAGSETQMDSAATQVDEFFLIRRRRR